MLSSADWCVGDVPVGTNGTTREGEFDRAWPRTRDSLSGFTSCMYGFTFFACVYPLSNLYCHVS
jgi:hypothetical protein